MAANKLRSKIYELIFLNASTDGGPPPPPPPPPPPRSSSSSIVFRYLRRRWRFFSVINTSEHTNEERTIIFQRIEKCK